MDALIARVNEIVSPAYLVGGSVRDLLMGREPKDYDFSTPLTPDEVETAVRAHGRKPYLVGKRFGTVGFRVDGQLVEVTTFRRESYLPQNRKPMVEFTDHLEDDLSRRDFTVNAIAIGPDGELVDPFGGREDIEAEVIRTVGDPFERLAEDPLRMLRAARFAAQLGFSVDEETLQAMSSVAHTLLPISRQRWTAELDSLLVSPDPAAGLEILSQTDLIRWVLPEVALQREYSDDGELGTLWQSTLTRVAEAPPVAEARWAALLADVALPFLPQPESRAPRCGEQPCTAVDEEAVRRLAAGFVEKIGLSLRWSSKRIAEVADLVTGDETLRRPVKRRSVWG